jgi:DNA-binding NarL/FixJ family response regulator
MDAGQISILIADDHPIFRAGLREILGEDSRMRIVAECADGEAALASLRSIRPKIAILDMQMPKLSGLDVAARAREEGLATAIIMLTICDSLEILNAAVEHGVLGYILKDSAPLDLIRSIDAALQGECFISPALSGRVLRRQHEGGGEVSPLPGISQLTAMERKILQLISRNQTSQDIADALSISPRTVDAHRSNISRKLGLKGSFMLVRYALQHKDLL